LKAKALCYRLFSGQLRFADMKMYLTSVRFSIVELSAGKIEIDGYDISAIGLNSLRRNLALVPQDNVLFLGTLRQNLYVD
jgi:ATP-binding cassette, subfamily C (CFTR/MRP), member 1